jgi:hypothetical protein
MIAFSYTGFSAQACAHFATLTPAIFAGQNNNETNQK